MQVWILSMGEQGWTGEVLEVIADPALARVRFNKYADALSLSPENAQTEEDGTIGVHDQDQWLKVEPHEVIGSFPSESTTGSTGQPQITVEH